MTRIFLQGETDDDEFRTARALSGSLPRLGQRQVLELCSGRLARSLSSKFLKPGPASRRTGAGRKLRNNRATDSEPPRTIRGSPDLKLPETTSWADIGSAPAHLGDFLSSLKAARNPSFYC